MTWRLKSFVFLTIALTLPPVYKAWKDPHCDGKTVIVHLFEWKWKDIAAECTRFLGPKGFCGVQVSPPNEHRVVESPWRPWWERYQPVSYKLQSRSGTEEEFKDMVAVCNSVGVRIYVDAVVNHMAGAGHRGTGTAGSYFDSDSLDFPGVPYSGSDFTPRDWCNSANGDVSNYNDASNVRNCRLVGLTDLWGGKSYVQDKVAGYFNNLINIGVAGFRVDAAKHMWPGDIQGIQSKLTYLNADHGFKAGSQPFFYHEVIDKGGEAIKIGEYTGLGMVTEFRYSAKIAWGVQDFPKLAGLYDQSWGMAGSGDAFVFVDNHDNQRGHGGAGDVVTHTDPYLYNFAVAYMLAHDYGFSRVMSSYYFGNTDDGPPANGDGGTKDVIINGDGSCGNGWVCEHRWPVIYRMVEFSNAVKGTYVQNYYNENNKVAFSRGNKGFFAMVKWGTIDQTFQTGMPAGTYCNLIDECQTSVSVDGNGNAYISIQNQDMPFLAICVGCGGTGGTVTPPVTTPTPPTGPPPEGYARTVVFVQKETSVGQDLFIRGGIDHNKRPGCTNSASVSSCALSMQTNSLGTTSHYAKYNAWRNGDSKLDWYGPEPGQGSYTGTSAEGTPLAWTSSSSSSDGYQVLNTYGDHYWMLDTNVNCDETENGWFELKAFVKNGEQWERDISQTACTGSAAGSPPYGGTNHMARCGFINVFNFNAGSCQIENFPA